MAEAAAGQNTEENNTEPPLLWVSQGKAEVAPPPLPQSRCKERTDSWA